MGSSGDIINFDVTVYLNGAFGDCSAMVCVGEVDKDARFLVDSTKQCLDEAVQMVGPGADGWQWWQVGHDQTMPSRLCCKIISKNPQMYEDVNMINMLLGSRDRLCFFWCTI